MSSSSLPREEYNEGHEQQQQESVEEALHQKQKVVEDSQAILQSILDSTDPCCIDNASNRSPAHHPLMKVILDSINILLSNAVYQQEYKQQPGKEIGAECERHVKSIQEALHALVDPNHDHHHQQAATTTTTTTTHHRHMLQLFNFIYMDVLPNIKNHINDNSNSNDSNGNSNSSNSIQQQSSCIIIVQIMKTILECLPNIIPCHISTMTEIKLMQLIKECSLLFPTGTKNMEQQKQQNSKSNRNNYNNTSRKEGNSIRRKQYMLVPVLVHSILKLLQKHQFTCTLFVLNIIHDLKEYLIEEDREVEDDNDDNNDNDDNKLVQQTQQPQQHDQILLQLFCNVIFMYTTTDCYNDKDDCEDAMSTNKNRNKTHHDSTRNYIPIPNNKNKRRSIAERNNACSSMGSTKGDNHDDTIIITRQVVYTLIQFVRQLVINIARRQDQHYQHQYQQHRSHLEDISFENKMIHDIIPYLMKSTSFSSPSLLVNGYKAMIESSFASNLKSEPSMTYATNNNNVHDSHGLLAEWTKLDVCVFLIIYHYHQNHLKDMNRFIDSLCSDETKETFPFEKLNEIIAMDHIQPIDDDKDGATNNKDVRISSSTRVSIPSHLCIAAMNIGLYLLLTPIHTPYHDNGANEIFIQLFKNKQKQQTKILHPTEKVMNETATLLPKVYIYLSEEKKEELINALLYLSSHTTFIPTMIQRITNEGKNFKNRSLNSIHERINYEPVYPLPCNLDKYFKDKVKTKLGMRHIYSVAITSLEIINTIISSKTFLLDTAHLKKLRIIMIDRVQHLSSSSSMIHSNGLLSNYNAVIRDEVIMFNFAMVEKMCMIIVMLSDLEEDLNERSHYFEELHALFHRLLVGLTTAPMISSTIPFPPTSEKKKRKNLIIVMGIILGKQLMLSSSICEKVKNMMFQSLLSILIPTTKSSDCALVQPILDPMIGYWGLDFLCSCCNDQNRIDNNTCHTITGQKSGNNSINKLFNCVKKMVANLGIVSRKSEIMKTFDESNTDKIRALAYKTFPAYFDGLCGQKKDIVFCIAKVLESMVSENGHNDLGSRVIELIRFLHSLVDIYLQTGRSLSPKWSADVWLTASIEIFGSHDFKFDLLSDTCSASDEGFQTETDDDETPIECAISILLSISIMHVVLNNSQDSMSSKKTHNEKERLVKMMQLCTAKIFDLRRIFKKIIIAHATNVNEYAHGTVSCPIDVLMQFHEKLFLCWTFT
jgi:hypothetical protein